MSEGRCAYVRRAIHWVKMKPRDPWKPELRRGSFRALELLLFRVTQQTRAVRAGLKRASLDAVSPRESAILLDRASASPGLRVVSLPRSIPALIRWAETSAALAARESRQRGTLKQPGPVCHNLGATRCLADDSVTPRLSFPVPYRLCLVVPMCPDYLLLHPALGS